MKERDLDACGLVMDLFFEFEGHVILSLFGFNGVRDNFIFTSYLHKL